MVDNVFNELAITLGVPLWFLIVAIVWSVIWKLLAMWKSAKKNSPIWFVVLAVINTLGILEILYIYVFSEMKTKKVSEEAPKTKRKSNRSRRARKR